MTTKLELAVIPGDGIGPEVTAEAVRVLEVVEEHTEGICFEYETYPWGSDYYLKHGVMAPEGFLDELRDKAALLLGAVGDPRIPDHVSLWGLLLPIRQGFDQYVNLRPVKLLAGVPCPLKDRKPGDIDMLVVRENTEGEYSGVGGRVHQQQPLETAVQTAVFTREGIRRVMDYSFRLARERGTSLTSITKSNALNYSMVLWDEVFAELEEEYPEVETQAFLVDAASMFFVQQPERFGVVVASNLFADILTDLGAALQGGLGFAASANLNPEGIYPSMFEPVHGSAPDIAGEGIANPLATIWATSMLLDHLAAVNSLPQLERAGRAVFEAIRRVAASPVKTPDLGGDSSTQQVGDQLRSHLPKLLS
jgi:tartrate dehydrogenase/decarboxylase/D-malate dehydrogenase